MADVRDILELERAPTPEVTKESFFGNTDKMKKKPFMLTTHKISKRPEGMHREVFALLYNDNKDAPPLFPTDTGMQKKDPHRVSKCLLFVKIIYKYVSVFVTVQK